MRDRVTGKRTTDQTMPEAGDTGNDDGTLDDPNEKVFDEQTEEIEAVNSDQLETWRELADEYLGDFIGDQPGCEGLLYTQHYLVCADCGKAGGTLHKTGHGDDATYRHLGGCDAQTKPFSRETRRKLGMR